MASGEDIFLYFKSNPCFKDLEIRMFFIDEDPHFQNSKTPFVYVFNTGLKRELSTGKLEHWVCLYYNGNDEKNIVFFDSLGDPIPNALLKNVSQHGVFKSYTQTNCPIQSGLSRLCGEYIVVFSYISFCVGLSFSQFLDLFSENRLENDKKVFDLYNRIFAKL